jgi:protein-disulfide isomerase
LVKQYGGKLRVVYMNMVVHPQMVQMGHLYGCAAAKQGKFAAYKDAWWAKAYGPYAAAGGRDRSSLDEANIKTLAADVGLDVARLDTDAHSDACKQRVSDDMTELAKFHVNGTPAFFINGKFIGGGIPKAQFEAAIEDRLKVVEQSGVAPAAYYETEIMGKGVHQFRSKKDARGP